MLYRVAAKILDGRAYPRQFADVEALSGDEAAALALAEFRKTAGIYGVIVDDVRPAPAPIPQPSTKLAAAKSSAKKSQRKGH